MTVSDSRRARELFRYVTALDLIPGGSLTDENDLPNISSRLVPFCQLVALRCKAPRVLLNVMDRNVMYFLSDASADDSSDDFDICEDPVLRACSEAVPLEGRICEMTIRLTATSDAAPTFVVNDLPQSKFSHLDVVSGPPYFRFYAGTPITTRNGVTIGSLAFLDTRSRDSLTQAEEQCLTRTAALVMCQLETNRQAIEGRRSMRLARSLEFFLAGQKSMTEDLPKPMVNRTNTYVLAPGHVNELASQPSPTLVHRHSHVLEHATDNETESDDFEERPQDGQGNAFANRGPESRSRLLARSANLIREGFGVLGEDGTVVVVSHRNRLSSGPATTSMNVEVVAASTASNPFPLGEEFPKLVLEDEALAGLVRNYPSGRMFVLDEPVVSSDEDASSIAVERSTRKSRKVNELKSLKHAFPYANQVLFAPVWDSDVGSYVHAVFVTNSAEDHSLSPIIELPFLKSFCSSVTAECARTEALKADKQKSDFVGTISHEMRSPLHGILASAEFMTDTYLTGYQRSLIDAVQSCGRTLLDTIDHVLDFSKISSFRKNWQAENKRTRGLGAKQRYLGRDHTPTPIVPALLQLTSVVDVAVVLEEVVDTLVLGRSFTSTVDITDLSRSSRGRGINRPEKVHEDEVSVSINIQKADWVFITQPGAIRRVVLNLAGNALKYTARGHIEVQLELIANDAQPEQMMVLTVTDTGRGIGPKFLNSLLYVPFAQENPLAPGTGLGLSIVHNIVTMLGGTIDIRSEIGQGTTAKATIPLQRPLPGQISTTTTPHSGTSVSSQASQLDDSIPWLQNQTAGFQAMIYRPTRCGDELQKILTVYVGRWYGLNMTDKVYDANVLITEEHDIVQLQESLLLGHNRIGTRAIIILLSLASSHDAAYTTDVENRIQGVVEWMSKPVGPHKLAKTIKNALQRVRTSGSKSVDEPQLESIAEKSTFITPNPVSCQSRQSRPKDISDGLHEMDLNQRGQNQPSRVVQASESISVSQTSRNAQKAICSPGLSQNAGQLSPQGDTFPFPVQKPDTAESRVAASGALDTSGRQVHSPRSARRSSGENDGTRSLKNNSEPHKIDPRILVVDDNKINSSLLKTFLTKKRHYTRVDCAENGQEATDLFTHTQGAYDVVFMDISMPIMDGFEATRVIRQFEKSNHEQEANGTLVIGLTGLSSARDQAEGFEAGMDIYLTKPVSLKAVGNLLDNWEQHRSMPPRESPTDRAERSGSE